MKTKHELLKSARRELYMRQRVYPRRVNEGRMKREDAQHEIDCMSEIVGMLEESIAGKAEDTNQGQLFGTVDSRK